MKAGLNDRRGKVSSTATRKPGSKGREEETEKLGLLSAGRHCVRNDLENTSGEVRGSFTERLTAEDFEGGGQEGAKISRGKWAREAWRRQMQ